MGVPPLTSLLGVADDNAFREAVIETVGDCPDLDIAVVETADTVLLPEVVRMLTSPGLDTHSPTVSAE